MAAQNSIQFSISVDPKQSVQTLGRIARGIDDMGASASKSASLCLAFGKALGGFKAVAEPLYADAFRLRRLRQSSEALLETCMEGWSSLRPVLTMREVNEIISAIAEISKDGVEAGN